MENKLLSFKKIITNLQDSIIFDYFKSAMVYIILLAVLFLCLVPLENKNTEKYDNFIETIQCYINDGYLIKYNNYELDNIEFLKNKAKDSFILLYYEPTYYINYTEKIIYFDN